MRPCAVYIGVDGKPKGVVMEHRSVVNLVA